MKVKVSEKEVRWLLNGKINKGSQANQMLKDELRELSVHFVDMQLGSNSYIWEWDGDEWKKYSEASQEELNIVEAEIEKVRQAVSMKTQKAEVLLTVPNIDYIFFRISDIGDVDIKFTGWGFSNYKPAIGKPIIRDIAKQKTTQKTRIAFLVDGLPVPNRDFHYKFSYMQKENLQQTGIDGFYTFDTPLVVGDNITLTDLISRKSFTLIVTLGKEEYIYDVTQYTSLDVTVTLDGKPLQDELVILRYNEKEYSLHTNNMGIASTQLPYMSNHSLELETRNSLQNHQLNIDGNHFCFSFETPVPEPPVIPDIPIYVHVTENNLPVVNEQVTFLCNEHSMLLTLDEHGKASATFPYLDGSLITVIVRNMRQQQILNNNGNLFEFSFDKIVNPVPSILKINLGVEESEGKPLKDGMVKLQQGTKELNCQLDTNGKCSFDGNAFQLGKEIEVTFTDKFGREIKIPFVIEENERNYLLVGQIKKKSPWIIMLEILLLVLLFATLYELYPYFCYLAEYAGHNII